MFELTKFYKGVVIDNNDIERRGRVQIKILGVNEDFPEESCFWAEVIYPTAFALYQGHGAFGVMPIGTAVWVQFETPSRPIVIGVLVGGTEEHTGIFDTKPNAHFEKRKGSGDIPQLAIKNDNPFTNNKGAFVNHIHNTMKNELNVQNSKKTEEALYLNTTILETKSGHLIYFNDQEGSEEIIIMHKSYNSCIKFTRNGDIDISANNINFNSVGNITFNAGKDITLHNYNKSEGGSVYIEPQNDVMINAKTGNCSIKASKNFSSESDGKTVIKSKKDIAISTKDVCSIQATKQFSIKTDGKGTIVANSDITIQAGKGSLQLSNSGTSLSSNAGNVAINASKCVINTSLDVMNGINCNGILSAMFVLAKDLSLAYFPSAKTLALNESVNSEYSEFKKSTTQELREIKRIPDKEIQKQKFDDLTQKVKDYNHLLYNKQLEIKKSALDDFIQEHIDTFGDINKDEIQYLTESVMASNGLNVEPRSPNGTSQKLTDCTCDWTDPKSWFNIDKPVWPTWEDFNNMFGYDIKFPNLQDLNVPIPKVSLGAVVKIIEKIIAKKVMKLVSTFRKMIMQMIRPIIDQMNATVGIINAIPPKIDFNLDLDSLIPNPIVAFPELPQGPDVPNWCQINECYNCKKCAKNTEQVFDDINKEIEDKFGPINATETTDTTLLPSGSQPS